MLDLKEVFRRDSVIITGGTMDGVVVGGSTPAAGTFTTVTVSGNIIGAGSIAFEAATDAMMTFEDQGTNTMRVRYTDTSLSLLHVQTAAYTHKIYSGNLTTLAIAIDNSANVGLGVADPDEVLEVNGTIHVNECVYFNAQQSYTPNAGNSNAVTVDLSTYQHPMIDCSTATDTCDITFTPPTGVSAGAITILQDDPARDFTWAVTGGVIIALGTLSANATDTASYYRVLSYKWDGTYLFLSLSDEGTTP
jgi:hypothetical protein